MRQNIIKKPIPRSPKWGPTFSQAISNLPLIRGHQIGREGARQSRVGELTTPENVNAGVDQYLLTLRALA